MTTNSYLLIRLSVPTYKNNLSTSSEFLDTYLIPLVLLSIQILYSQKTLTLLLCIDCHVNRIFNI